uniref:Uncharacterized protein n=1 Tax=Candidatus Kentrum sp. FM TaxID=2126340 RepID=A0A450WMF4_9GAMM|nr:MAG: hypothetical protein BECKFM1743A_GA0114220_104993 [Candidatus Kentron sp. FM]VFJ69947.1 MAG: hypothetical protein BECKFM1743C_GA0114222_105383 [Candidatus Kentron sp. FM]VFK18189.1 MAG: hypothetical protein BECKFM1743B_GA0114221_105303 [Candidatus Kentron sp. FM]
MIHTIEAAIDESDHIRLTEPANIKGVHRALVTVLDEPPGDELGTALPSGHGLPMNWESSEKEKPRPRCPTFSEHLLSMPRDDGDFERSDLDLRKLEP